MEHVQDHLDGHCAAAGDEDQLGAAGEQHGVGGKEGESAGEG